jgi:hypothetical protein
MEQNDFLAAEYGEVKGDIGFRVVLEIPPRESLAQ